MMWKKKLSMILLASVVALSFTTVTLPDQADAKRSYSSSKKSFSKLGIDNSNAKQ